MPCRVIVCDVGTALSVRIMLPFRLPVAVGRNSIPKKQLVAGPSDCPAARLQEVWAPASE